MRDAPHVVGTRQAVVLALEIAATERALARVTSLLASRRLDLESLDAGPPVGGRRRVRLSLRLHPARLMNVVAWFDRLPEVEAVEVTELP